MNEQTKSYRGRSILFVDYAVPQYDNFAGSRTNFMYLELLVQMGLRVIFLPADFKRIEPYSTELNNLGIETLDGSSIRKNWLEWLKEHGQDIDYAFFNKPEPTEKFLDAIKDLTQAAIIYQCHDLHYLRLQRKAEIEGSKEIHAEARRYELLENNVLENSDVILTFSSVEEEIIRSKYPQKKVFTVPLYFYGTVPESVSDFSLRQDLLFVGGCAHTPNHNAVTWLCNDILPLVLQELPDVVINIVGNNPPEDIRALQSKNVLIWGGVSDEQLNQLYKCVRLTVLPLRFGAGVKGKLIETFYNGVPFVSTAIGLEGIAGIEAFASAQNDPAGFAAEVVALYKDEKRWLKASHAGSSYISGHLTVEKTAKRMADILRDADSQAIQRIELSAAPRSIAFYLPQYHPIKENDEWWGKGFTEWRNVGKAEPLFPGHYQPHVPADLGFYDLRLEETRIAQAALARAYGIHGFCFYHYWFNGRRLLEHPVEEILSSGKPDFPFCLCWANENWTRRWDGEDQHVLMEMEYSEEDDRAHIRDMFRFFKDERYIRINGKPLFMVYRTENLPDPARTAEVWREEARKAGIGELYLMRVESIGKCDPETVGFDASLEFAPDWWNKGPKKESYPAQGDETPEGLEAYNEVYANNYVHSYDTLVETMLAKPVPSYKWMRCVTPSWDNTARRKEGAHIFLGAEPKKYRKWLSSIVEDAKQRLSGDEQIVFLNAWNEWAEGNHLEPDLRWGHAYLEATRDALLPVKDLLSPVSPEEREGSSAPTLIKEDAEKVSSSVKFLIRSLSHIARSIWLLLPIGPKGKSKLKSQLFTWMPFLFRHTQAYQNWKMSEPHRLAIEAGRSLQKNTAIDEKEQYVPLINKGVLTNLPVRLIAFYLPQFHTIPENDEWWGKGFTEWTNVIPAEPQFEGHYQPHVPGELGYYDLLDPTIQRRQVELAKLYGIGGFCFYFYWFGGKRLLEKPIENYLNDDALDLPFCLCWANENWSRRWDGLDKDILISQHHSEEDDLAFIEHIAKYLESSRYIRIDGKPLLLVYRPSLLPSAKETVKRWREWCRENGIGEIYLACTQSFDMIDPIKFGFDAAVEFPPNNTAPPSITDVIPGCSPTFAGHVYDWRAYPERSKNYKDPAYTLFRGVTPSWDNTARKKENGTILYGSSPLGYQQWLTNAIQDTVNRFPNHDQRLVFINAWNEWAEGAHLEPDERYGYAYLEATRMSQIKMTYQVP